VQGASDAGLIPMFFPDYKSVEDPQVRGFYEDLWDAKLDPKRGLTVVEIMDAIHDGRVRGMYVMGENPAMSDPDVQHAREALAKLDHLVVQDIFLTETAKYADVVLPASAWPEKDGTVTNTNRQVQIGRKALPLPGEARQDLAIIVALAKGLGLDWTYAHPREVFAEMTQAMPSLRNITWERLERESSVTYPCDAPDEPGHDIVFGNGFPTPTGRGRFVPARLVSPAEEPDAEYPMVLTTGRQLEHWHTGSMTRRSSVLDDLEPEAVAYVSARDMERIGLRSGDKIRVSTRRGAIELKARIDGAIPPGLIFIPFAYAEGGGQRAHQPAARPVRQDPGVQVLRGPHRARRGAGGGRGGVEFCHPARRPSGGGGCTAGRCAACPAALDQLGWCGSPQSDDRVLAQPRRQDGDERRCGRDCLAHRGARRAGARGAGCHAADLGRTGLRVPCARAQPGVPRPLDAGEPRRERRDGTLRRRLRRPGAAPRAHRQHRSRARALGRARGRADPPVPGL
jgi:hypothetical protein